MVVALCLLGLAFMTLAAISMLVIQSDNLFQRSYLFKQILYQGIFGLVPLF